jgi:hypothetical protein
VEEGPNVSDAKICDAKTIGVQQNVLLVVWGLSPGLLLMIAALGFGALEDAKLRLAATNMVLLVALLAEIAWAMSVVRPIDLPWALRILAILPITFAITYVNVFLALAGWCMCQYLLRLLE